MPHLYSSGTRRVIAVLALWAVVVTGCSAPKKPRPARVPVTVATAELRTVPLELAAVGTVEPLAFATVHAQVGGIVTAIRFREGDEVRAGQTLFQLDRTTFEALHARARAALARSRAQARSAQLDADRAGSLFAQQLISSSEHDQKRAAAEAARAGVLADSAAALSAALDLAHASVRAPISGRTGEQHVHVGDLVKANATEQPLVEIRQVQPVRVRFMVSERDLALVQRAPRGEGRVWASPVGTDSTQASLGRLVFVDQAVDPASGTVLLKAEFANADRRLWPGGTVDVRLVAAQERDVCVIPGAAITHGQQGTFVFVLEADTTVRQQMVAVRRMAGEFAVIDSGIAVGDVVVTDGQFRLSKGSKVLLPERTARQSGGAQAPSGKALRR